MCHRTMTFLRRGCASIQARTGAFINALQGLHIYFRIPGILDSFLVWFMFIHIDRFIMHQFVAAVAILNLDGDVTNCSR